MAAPRRTGLILPSSNVVVEEAIANGVGARDGQIYHVTRLTVTDVTLDAASRAQFDRDALDIALAQLLEAEVDAVVFAGTAGAWLGLERERAWCRAVERRAGIAVSTTSLLCLDGLRRREIDRLTLLTPFTDDIHAAIARTFEDEGLRIEGGACFGLRSSRRMATVSGDAIAGKIYQLRPLPDVPVLCFCTNFRGFEAQAALLDRLPDVEVLDSVELTLCAPL